MVTASIRTRTKVSQPHKYSADRQAKITLDKTKLTRNIICTSLILLITIIRIKRIINITRIISLMILCKNIIIRDYGKLGFGGITPIMQRQKKNHRVPPDQMVCHYTLLCAIISRLCALQQLQRLFYFIAIRIMGCFLCEQ